MSEQTMFAYESILFFFVWYESKKIILKLLDEKFSYGKIADIIGV